MRFNIDKIEKKQDKIFKDMDLEEIENYINNIARDYYKNIVCNDKVKFDVLKNNLNKLLSIHKDKNLNSYIIYSLNIAFFEILNNSIDNDLDLNIVKLHEPIIYENSKSLFVRKNMLDNTIEYIRNQKVIAKEREFFNKNPTYNDLLEFFNYDDYVVK